MTDFLEYAKQKLQERESINSKVEENIVGGLDEKSSERESTNEPKTSDLPERKLDLFKVNKILQDDLDRQIILPDSDLKKYHNFYKALDEDKASYQQQYVGANKAAKQNELRVKTREFFEQIKAKHPANTDAINLLQKDLTKKIGADVDATVASLVPYLMLQTITYFDQINKIQDSEAKSHYLSQFPMGTEDEYQCVGGFSARLNPILMILNSKNLHLTSAHQSAASSSKLNRGDNVHQQAMMSALFGINLKDELYLLPAANFDAEELWQAYLDYPVKLQEQFLLQQEQVRKNVIDLAKLFTDLKNEASARNIKKLKQEFSLNDADFYEYDEYSMPIVDDEKVEAELEKRANNYYPSGIDLPTILQEGAATIKDFNAHKTSEIIRDILNDSDSSPSEKNVAFNYLWIRAVKAINDSNTAVALSKVTEEDLLQILTENITDEQIELFFEQKEQQSLDILQQIASSDDSTLTQNKLVLVKDELALNKISGKQDLLLYAAKTGYPKVVEKLLAAPLIDVNQPDQRGFTALMIAAKNGHVEVVEKLLAFERIDVNQTDHEDVTALMIAANRGHLEVVEKLLEDKRIDVNQADQRGFTALMIAAKNGHVEVVEKLLAFERIDVNQADQRGFTALMIAAKNGHVEVVEKLLAFERIDVNQADQRGFTALMIAADNGHVEVVEKLLEDKRIDVNQANKNDVTALMFAASKDHVEVVEKLLEDKRIDVNQANKNDLTALMFAAVNRNLGVVEKLLATPGIDVDWANEYGETALIFAANVSCPEVVEKIFKKLCKDGVDTNSIAYIKGDRPKIFSDANKISSFANQICAFISPQFNFSMAGQQKLKLLVRKSLFKEIFDDDNQENVDSITNLFAQDGFKESIAETIAKSLQSSNGVIQPSKSKLSFIPFNNAKTLNIEHNGIEDLVSNPIKELIKQALKPDSNSIHNPSAVVLKSTEINTSRL